MLKLPELTKNVPLLNIVLAAFITLSLALTAITIDQVRSLNSEARGKPTTCCPVTMQVSPNPVPAYGTVYKITGTGFTPGAGVNFVLNGVATFAVADSTGSASSIWTSWTPGTYTAYAKELSRKGYVTVGTITFQVASQ